MLKNLMRMKVTKSAVELWLIKIWRTTDTGTSIQFKVLAPDQNEQIKAIEVKIKEINNINRFRIHIHVY